MVWLTLLVWMGLTGGLACDDSPRLKPGASGMTLVCRPTPFVRFMHTSETKLTATCVAHGTANVWYASAFTQGSLPWNLQTLLSCQCAKELLIHSFERTQKWKVFLRLRAARLSSPCVNAGAFRRGLVRGELGLSSNQDRARNCFWQE